MNIIQIPLPWAYLIEPKVFGDERGFFMETFSEKRFEDAGITITWVQDNHSKSAKGVLRWMHFQTKKPQDKLVRVVAGAVYDVIIDCRVWSETYGERYGVILSAENKKQLLVPKWFAHGFLTLEEWTEFLYKVSDVYDPDGEWGVQWDDKEVGIDRQSVMKEYGISAVQLSAKDKSYQPWNQLPAYFDNKGF